MYVTLPDPETGEGGGRVEADNGDWDDFDYEFDAVRRRIDKRLGRWKSLPDPDSIAVVAAGFESIATQLRQDGSGTLASLCRTLDGSANSAALQGNTMTAFRQSFSDPLPVVLSLHSAVAAGVMGYMQAQVGLWGAARMNFVDIAQAYTDAFNAVSKGGNGDVDVMIRVLQYAASAIGVNGVGGMMNLTADTLDLASWTAQRSQEHASRPGSYEACVDHLTRALDELHENVRFTEEEIWRKVGEDIREIGSTGAGQKRSVNNRLMLDLSDRPTDTGRPGDSLSDKILDDFSISDESKIGWCGDAISSMVDRTMADMVGSLSDIQIQATDRDEDISSVVRRDERVGMGTYGPSWMVREMNELLCDLVGGLCEDIVDKGDQLKAAYAYHLSVEEATRDRLATANAEFMDNSWTHNPWVHIDMSRMTSDPGTTRDPWDYEVPSVPEPGADEVDEPRKPLEY